MTRYGGILWTGRVLTLIYTVAMLYDILGDGSLSREIRMTTIGVVGVVFAAIALWQTRIAWKYEGMPTLPHLPFRWVVVGFFGAAALFVWWNIIAGTWPGLYSDRRSSFFWWALGSATLWFASRWVTVDEPHVASIGETGSAANTNGV